MATWTKLETRVRQHPKIVATIERLGNANAAWFWICGNAYCRDALTDGFIATAMVSGLAPGLSTKIIKGLPDVLVNAGLWEVVPGGYQVHDFLHHNPTKADIEKRREEDRNRKGIGADSNRNRRGDFTDSSSSRARVAPAGAFSTSISSSPEGVQGEPSNVAVEVGPPADFHAGPKRHGGLIQRPGQWGNIHGTHVTGFCDWMCLPQDTFLQFATRLKDEAAALKWAHGVRVDHEAKHLAPTGKPWDFWTRMFDARPVQAAPAAIPRAEDWIREQEAKTTDVATPEQASAALRKGFQRGR